VLAAVLSIKQPKFREFVSFATAMASLTLFVQTDLVDDLIDYYPRMTNAMLPLGEALGENLGSRGTLVMGDAGQVPFVSGWNLLDTNFLSTPASLGLDGIANEIKRRDSTVLALYAEGPFLEDAENSQVALLAVAKTEGYSFIGSITWRDNYWFHIWVSPDLATNDTLMRGLSEAIEISRNRNLSLRIRHTLMPWFWGT
jgi:hypothetical protein